jgi:uncharacterized protein YndB with AHSA1/START domain
MTDLIEESIDLKAPVERVWRALTDHNEFGTWFRVKLDGPFVPGELSTGYITYPGYEHIKWRAKIERMEPLLCFSFRWHPYAIDPDIDYSQETPTLVEFRLEEIAGGTRVTVVESGFENVPSDRRAEAFRMNSAGWDMQMQNIWAHLDA